MTDYSKIADDLERLCCAETEGKFFDYVADSITDIIAGLRRHAPRSSDASEGWRDGVVKIRDLAIKLGSGEIEAFSTELLLSMPVPAEVAPDEAVAWWNGCDRTVPAALRFLADNERPVGGQQKFNSEHLYQLAAEIERMASKPLYARPQSGMREALSKDAMIDIIMRETTDKIVADGWDHIGSPNVLVQGCKFIRRAAHNSPEGYANPTDAAKNFAGFIADAILATLQGRQP